MAFLTLIFLGCNSGDCTLLKGTKQENCWFEKAKQEGIENVIPKISTAESRDLLRLRIIVNDPSMSPSVCKGAETDLVRKRCETFFLRPHLHHD